MKKQKVVIVGGGFGGVKAALELADQEAFDVTLISDSDNLSYYPTMYHTATGGSREVSSIPLHEILDYAQVSVIYAKVASLDRAQKRVITTTKHDFSYDYLILALGVVTNYFGIPGLPEFSYGIKSLGDAEELKRHLHDQIVDHDKPDLNYVVVGGGPSGIELAGVLGDYVEYICKKHTVKRPKFHVDLVEAAPRLIPRMPAAMAKKIGNRLKQKGVKVYLNAKVQGQTANELLVNGKPIRSHTVVWTAGVTNSPFFKEQNFQIARNGKVRVDQFLQAEPSIFVIGDNADTPFSGMAQTAIYDAIYVAKALKMMTLEKITPRPYKAKKPIYVMPAGPNWAAVLWGDVKLYGQLGWSIRRVADFIGYKDYEPFFKATRQWFTEYQRQDQCEICQPDAERVPKLA